MSEALWLAEERVRYVAEQERLRAKKVAYNKMLGVLWEESCRREELAWASPCGGSAATMRVFVHEGTR